MGFFSWQCRGCNHPLLSIYSANDKNAWMIDSIVLTEVGVIIFGPYDGYGRIEASTGDVDFFGDYGDKIDVWHQACWIAAGGPTYQGPAERARDQGFFFDDEHDIDPPTVKEEA